MKKIISAILLVVMLAVALTACTTPAAEKDYKLGMGVVFGDMTNAQINATVASVVLDKDGKIVACKIDAIQNKYTVDTAVTFSELRTKREQQFDYKMSAFGTSLIGNETVKEWFEQAAAFEAWCVGKTIAEVQAMPTQVKGEHNYVISADEALLGAGCTISITDFINAVVKAGNDEQGVSFKTAGTVALGLAANNADDSSSIADGIATVKMNCDLAATVVVDGKIAAAVNDAIQPQVKIENGEVIEKSVGKGADVLKTKRELKEDYKMAAFGTSLIGNDTVVEWYLQSAAFSKHIVGKTSAEVEGLPTQTKGEHNYVISADDALLGAGCTMSIDGIIAVVVESIANAK